MERGLQEQSGRQDVTPEAAKPYMVLHDFLISGRRWRAAAQGARDGHQLEDLPPISPIRRRQWPWRVVAPDVPLIFRVRRVRPAAQGADVPPPATPVWTAERALSALNITEVPFEASNANWHGYARGRTIGVSSTSPLPHLTRFHELAHVLLGHTTAGDQYDGDLTPRNLQECEAETVARLCCAALELPGVAFSSRYIQGWWGSGKIPERSAQRILKAVDQILDAGVPSPADGQGQS